MAADRIAFVCPRFAEHGTVGGAETLLKQLAERAGRAGREVTFLTTCAEDHFTWANDRPAGRQRIGDLTVEFFPVDEDRDLERFLETQDAISRGLDVSDEDERAWIDNNVNSRALCDHLVAEGDAYDRIVIGPYLFGLVWNAAQVHPDKTLLVPCLHDEPFAYVRLMRALFDRVSGFLFNTPPERDLAKRLYAISDAACHVVGMGLDPFDTDASSFAAAHDIRAPYVLYAGRREVLKGTPLLVEFMHAFRKRTDRDVKLVCTGSGSIEAPPDMEPHVIDAGFVSETDKHAAMAGAVAFCHPSVNESLGIVILESWLAGTPCLVHAGSDVLQYQCRTGNGGLWFRTYPEFEGQLSLLLDRPDIRDRLGSNGRAYVRRDYAWATVERRLFAALDGTE